MAGTEAGYTQKQALLFPLSRELPHTRAEGSEILNPRALLQTEKKTKSCLRREQSWPARGGLSPLSQGPPASLRAAGARLSRRLCEAAHSPRRFRAGLKRRMGGGERLCLSL